MKSLLVALYCVILGVSAAYAQSSAVVVDKNGKLVGPLLQNGAVVVEVNGTLIQLQVSEKGFLYENSPQYFYTGTDCTGPARISALGFPRSGFLFEGLIYYAQGVPQTIRVGSIRLPDNSCFRPANFKQPVAPQTAQTVTSLGVTQPFKVRLQ